MSFGLLTPAEVLCEAAAAAERSAKDARTAEERKDVQEVEADKGTLVIRPDLTLRRFWLALNPRRGSSRS